MEGVGRIAQEGDAIIDPSFDPYPAGHEIGESRPGFNTLQGISELRSCLRHFSLEFAKAQFLYLVETLGSHAMVKIRSVPHGHHTQHLAGMLILARSSFQSLHRPNKPDYERVRILAGFSLRPNHPSYVGLRPISSDYD